MFGWPILMAALGMIGLISALVGDGVWDALSWVALAAPVLVIAWHMFRRSAPTRRWNPRL